MARTEQPAILNMAPAQIRLFMRTGPFKGMDLPGIAQHYELDAFGTGTDNRALGQALGLTEFYPSGVIRHHRSAAARGLSAEIRTAHMLVLDQVRTGTGQHHASGFEQISVVAHLKRRKGVLFN